MSRTIQQHILDLGQTTIQVSASCVNVGVKSDQGNLVLFVILDPDDSANEQRIYETYVNGQIIPDDPGDYVGSAQLSVNGIFYHVYDITRLQ